VNYYAVAGGRLANEIATVSGQGPTKQTTANCPVYKKITPATRGSNGQVIGNGCVYPTTTKTIASQLTAAHDTWKAYIQGIGTAKGDASPCSHPKLNHGNGPPPSPKHPYATWTNPFMYFAAITGGSNCTKENVGLDQLTKDLKSASTTPSVSFVVPSPCDNGSDTPCAHGAQAGLGPAESFLKSVVPKIEASPGYKVGGMIVITFDQAQQTGPHADHSSCCDTPAYPNVPSASASAARASTVSGRLAVAETTTSTTSTTSTPTTTTGTTTATTTATTATATSETSTTTTETTTSETTTTPVGGGLTNPTGGGGEVGALLISPWVKPNTNDVLNYYNHYSLLGSIEMLFGLGRIGYSSSITLQTIPIGDFQGSGPS
jgi:phosphatidylinositol-3-phosphatase